MGAIDLYNPRLTSENIAAYRGANALPRSNKMYAIAFDMDTSQLCELYHTTSYQNAYSDIKRHLQKYGFDRQQGSVYFGDPEKVDAVTCVLAIMDLAKTYPWFGPSVRDIRMLRIEENNDLMPAVERGTTGG